MANRLSADIAASTLTDVTAGGIASGKSGAYEINLCNRGASDRSVRIAVTGNVASGAVTLADYIEYNETVEANNGILARWPIPLSEGSKVWVFADGVNISATLIGLERT